MRTLHIVYVLTSVDYPDKYYVGYTTDINKRLKAHNNSESGYSKRYAPWNINAQIIFNEESAALQFERYLKEGSGQAFLKKHLLPK